MTTFSTILVNQVTENIVQITLNRPHRLNALNNVLLDEFVEALRAHASTQIIILQGAGDRAFCAGEDLKESLAPSGTPTELRHAFERLQDITRLTSMSSAIVIAAVNGYAVGGGAEIALAADFVIGSPKTVFRFPEVPIGHAATGGITGRLTALVGLLKAKELLIKGEFVDATTAKHIGLLTELVDDPKQRALELAAELAKLPSVSARESKMSLERATFPMMESVLKDEINAATISFAQPGSSKAFDDFAARKKASRDTAASIEPPKTLNEALSRAFRDRPDATFLKFARGGPHIKFREMEKSVKTLAANFKWRGIGKGDRVIMMMGTSPEAVSIWFALNWIGAIWVPINTELKSITLEHVISAADATLLITDKSYYQTIIDNDLFDKSSILIREDDLSLPWTRSLTLNNAPPLEAAKVSPWEPSALLYTSGSTGRSKPCLLSHQYFAQCGFNLIKVFSLTSEDTLFCPFPLCHVDATALTIIPALLLQTTAALSPRYSASRFWDDIRETDSTVYDFMGATLALTFKQPPSNQDKNHRVRLAWGVPIPTWAAEFEERFGHKIAEVYGSVECGLPVAHNPEHERVPGSCGKVIQGTGYTLRIADENDQLVPPNTTGHVLIRCDSPNSIFSGYFNVDSSVNAEIFRNTWLHTGDLARVDEKGNMFFVGRAKDVIRRRGENIPAFSVEEEVLAHPSVRLVAAVGVPSQLGNGTEEELMILVEPNHGVVLTEAEIFDWCKVHLARFMIPEWIEVVHEGVLALTETGKIDKAAFRGKGLRSGAKYFDIRAAMGAVVS